MKHELQDEFEDCKDKSIFRIASLPMGDGYVVAYRDGSFSLIQAVKMYNGTIVMQNPEYSAPIHGRACVSAGCMTYHQLELEMVEFRTDSETNGRSARLELYRELQREFKDVAE